MPEILKKVAETYKAASQYDMAADATLPGAKTGTHATSHMRVAFQAPDKYRMEGAIPGISEDPALSEGVIVHDGSTMWFYFPKSNQYGSIPSSAVTDDAPGDLGDLRPEAIDHYMMWRYRGAADSANRSGFLREDAIEIAGVKVVCYVLTVSPKSGGSAYTWWVDKQRYRILREDRDGSRTVYTSIKLNEPLAAELFKFVPPPGAKKMVFGQ